MNRKGRWFSSTHHPFLFRSEDRQRAINEFYGVQNPEDPKECTQKRPRAVRRHRRLDQGMSNQLILQVATAFRLAWQEVRPHSCRYA